MIQESRGDDARADAAAKRASEQTPAREESRQRDTAILCAECGNPVTSDRHRIQVLDTHEHRFMNLVGAVFHFGCFAEAIGCLVVGPLSLEFAWFPGFAWRFAHCSRCGEHLGWHFERAGGLRGGEGEEGTEEEGAFFGLVLRRLRETGAAPPAA